MRPPKPLTLIALLLLQVQTVGCRSFQPITEPLPTQPRSFEDGKKPVIRVETLDRQRVTLYAGWMDSVNVGGVKRGRHPYPNELLVFPLSEVRTIEQARFDKGETVLLFLVSGLVIGAIAQNLATTCWTCGG